nr:hypothetical protein [Klebsiella quasivariicola]
MYAVGAQLTVRAEY